MKAVGNTKVGEYELKYAFPSVLAPMLEDHIAAACGKDPLFYFATVKSIYFANRRLTSLQEKINSDLFKTKFRLRWYETAEFARDHETSVVDVFFEKKYKIGAKRQKKRQQEKWCWHDLVANDLSSSYFQRVAQDFNESNNCQDMSDLQPLIQISYKRKRFVDRVTGQRISIDYDIRAERTNRNFLPEPLELQLEESVVEVKGESDSVPPSLQFLIGNFCKKASFSKFERCILKVSHNRY